MSDTRSGRRSRGPFGDLRGLALATAVLAGTAACDTLLDVDLPGAVEEHELNDPLMSETLALGAVADFECAFTVFAMGTGLHADEFLSASTLRNFNIWGSRNDEQRNFGSTGCEFFGSVGVWRPFQTARFQAEDAVERIRSFEEGSVDDRDFLIGKSLAYAGYTYTFLSEAFCTVAFDGSPEMSREDGWNIAVDRFTEALEHLGRAGGAEAEELTNMALVGRARANLNLGNHQAVLDDASRVSEGFVRYSTHSTTTDRRRNRIYNRNNITEHITVHPRYHDLEVAGVPDPRVPVEDRDGTGPDGITAVWHQHKYASEAADMPFASGREAQLMIAEVEGGQTAVDIINDLRATYDLPEFSSTDETEILRQVVEERRRELWMQGTRIGDMLRYDDEILGDHTWEYGPNQKGEPYGDNTCLPLMDSERQNNPNL